MTADTWRGEGLNIPPPTLKPCIDIGFSKLLEIIHAKTQPIIWHVLNMEPPITTVATYSLIIMMTYLYLVGQVINACWHHTYNPSVAAPDRPALVAVGCPCTDPHSPEGYQWKSDSDEVSAAPCSGPAPPVWQIAPPQNGLCSSVQYRYLVRSTLKPV